MSILFIHILCFCLVSYHLGGAFSSEKTFTDIRGTFSSEREINGYYAHNITVEYKIIVPSGRRAILSFTEFNVSGSMPNCTEDSVEIFVGCQKNRSVGKYCSCGLASPLLFDFYSIDECITLTFKSDEKYAAEGFAAVYSSAPQNQAVNNNCSTERKTSQTGVQNIFTPLWPNNYTTNTSCAWSIEIPVNYATIIQFMDFEIERTVFCHSHEEQDDRVMIQASKSGVDSSSDIEVIQKRICSKMTDSEYRKSFKVIVPKGYRRVYIDFINDQDQHVGHGFAAGLISYISDPSLLESCRKDRFGSTQPSLSPQMLFSTYLLFFVAFSLLVNLSRTAH